MTSGGSQTLADIGEFGLIDVVASVFTPTPAVLIGSGDDAASLATSGPVLVSTDLLIERRHFRRDWSEAADVGHRAAASSLADIAAMGGTATGLVVGFGGPPDLPVFWVRELAEGMAEEVAKVGATVVGGDVSSADQVVLAVTAFGHPETEPVTRSGARPSQVVALAGRVGWAAAGLAVLGRGFRSPRALVEAYRRPEVPYPAGPQAAAAGAAAMIDVSDGLLADLGHIATASGVAIDVESGALEIAEPLEAVGSAVGVEPVSFCLTGGEDHALAATFDADAELPDGWRAIGRVVEGSGVTVDGEEYEGAPGHTHFG
ncbi:MAG TPA: thiamine-phosphate kinase [Nocardioidaceae bacterium]|nr:thiamine-phosphate kinase [Nocardioidaceae bacterium]